MITMQGEPRILMGRPDHFSVSYAINPWMDPARWATEGEALTAISRQEWRALHRELQRLGATVDLIPAVPGLPDLVFTANAAVVMDGKALLARFRHPQRQHEESVIKDAFRRLTAAGIIDEMHLMPEGVVLEGAGDCVWDRRRGIFWLGYGQRSDAAAQPIVEACFDIETVALELADARFYHMDTALCPLTGGEVMYVPAAFTAVGLAKIRARVAPELRLEIAAEDAVKLAANAICLGDQIVLADCSAELRARLEARGYQVHITPLEAFRRSGGSAFCLTLRLDHRSGAALSALPARAALEPA